jgi:hypothetical protein
MNKENTLREVIAASLLDNQDKVESVKYLEELIEKASMYDR